MAQGMSRTQRKKANEMQQKILSPVIDYAKTESIVGKELAEQLSHLQLLKEMSKFGLVAKNDIDELSLCASVCVGAYISQKIQHERLKLEKDIKDNFDNIPIDTRKLFIGQVFKNYNELCKFLNVEIKTGKARQLQEQFFRCYFDYEKLKYSNELVILEIYSEPIFSNKNAQYRSSKYVNQLKILILYELLLSEPDENGNVFVKTTYSKLIKQLGLINAYYFADTRCFFVDKFCELFPDKNVVPQTVYNKLAKFKGTVKQVIHDSITYALGQLQKDHLVTTDKYHVIDRMDGTHSRATKDEEIQIQMVMKEAANQLGYKNSFFAEIYKPAQFRELCDNLYRKKQWNYIYYQVEIGSKKEYLCKHINEFTAYPEDTTIQQLTVEDINQYLMEYKNNLCSSLEEKWQEKGENEQEKQIDEIKKHNVKYNADFENCDDEIIRFLFGLDEERLFKYYNDEYVIENTIFSNYLIKDDSNYNEELAAYIRKQSE